MFVIQDMCISGLGIFYNIKLFVNLSGKKHNKKKTVVGKISKLENKRVVINILDESRFIS